MIGPKKTELQHFIVWVDSKEFEKQSLLEALYFLLQIYITFNIGFPAQSENIYQYFLNGVCNILTKKVLKVPKMVNKLNRCGFELFSETEN